jgi:hypothetical protein
MTTFFASFVLDQPIEVGPEQPLVEVLNFSIEAADMLTATRIASAYLKGRFEGSGKGGEISHIGRTKVHGQEYRGL